MIHCRKHWRQRDRNYSPYRKVREEFPDILEDVRLNHKLPLLIEIPDRHGTGRAPDFITSFVNESIGLKL